MVLNRLLALLNLRLTRKSTFDVLFEKAFYSDDYKQQIDVLLTSKSLGVLRESKSQLQQRQDMFVIAQLNFKTNGYFVEFGAANGVDLSNTYLLEKKFGWSGILSEPSISFHEHIQANRNCHIETKCVWRVSNETLQFNECDIGELSTLVEYSQGDIHADLRRRFNQYSVETISLNDLLVKFNAPREIDYLSIDTEGSEFEILNALDFDRYKFKIITCEHNHKLKQKIFDLLTSNGYRRVYENLSKCDDWYMID